MNTNDSTDLTPYFECPANIADIHWEQISDAYESSEHKQTFKKNDMIKFMFKKKTMSGKITKIGESGVDVRCNGKYYYCHDYDEINKMFRKANYTKNYR